VDGKLRDATRLGGAFTFARSNVDGKSSAARQSGDVDSYQAIFYGSHSLDDRTDVNFQADYGVHRNKGVRHVVVGPITDTARSRYDGWSAHFGAGVGRIHALNEKTTFTPSVRADYTTIRNDGYTEAGAAYFNRVAVHTTKELILGVDGKLAHALDNGVTLTANLGVGYDTLSKRDSITSAFVGGGAAFATQGIDPSPWLARGGLGLVYTTSKALEITARYDIETRSSGFDNQTASVKLRMPF